MISTTTTTMKTRAKTMTGNEARRHIAKHLELGGFSDRDIKMILAGATLLGYLADERASWARDYLIRKYFTNLEPLSQTIENAGEINIDRDLFRDLLIKPF